MKFNILTVMFLIFMTLKLLGVISWSWWWVTLPLWGGLAVAAIFGAIALGIEIWVEK